MKPLLVPPSAWPGRTPAPSSSSNNQQQPVAATHGAVVPVAASPTPSFYSPFGAGAGGGAVKIITPASIPWFASLPENVFSQLITAAIAQGPVVRS